jgi:uncharacterized protein YjcR
MLVEGEMTQVEIADALNVTPQTISNWKKNEEFASELRRANRAAIASLVPKATNKIKKLLNAENEQVQLAAAKDILDRAGYKSENKVQVEGTLTTDISKLDRLIEQMDE